MFQPLEFDYTLINSADQKDYCAPITSQEGTIIVNTEVLAENNLEMPTCLKDLTKPEYKDLVSVTDVKSSSTAWLLIQALVSEYSEDGAKEVLSGIYENAGPHMGGDTNPLAQEMAECIITQGRSELQKYYPNAVYEGETTDEANSSAYPKVFPEPLTLDLLEKHQELSESCK